MPDVVARLLSQALSLFHVEHAAVLLEDGDGALRLVDASSEQAKRMVSASLTHDGGPDIAAFTSRQPVVLPQLDQLVDRWPVFVHEAQRLRMTSACAFPLRVDEITIGSLVLFARQSLNLSERDLAVGQALAMLTTIGIANHHTVSTQTELSAQLQGALESRIVIEQAKGIIAAQQGLEINGAFDVLRHAARGAGRSLSDLAAEVVASRVPLPRPTSSRQTGPPRAH